MILQTDYTRRIWTGMSTDDWGQADLQEGDVIYIMDDSICLVVGENNVYQLPDLGGGGGGGEPAPNTYALTIVNNKSAGTATQKRINARNLIEKASDQWYLANKSISGGATGDVAILAPLINQYGTATGYLMISAKTASAFAFNDASLASLYGSFTDGTGAYIYLIAIKDTNAVTVTVTDA